MTEKLEESKCIWEAKPDEKEINMCPNMIFDQRWDGEKYSCPVCGEYFFLDYEDMA